MEHQIHAIEIYKWAKSEKVGHDLGDEAVRDWICKYASTFRERYEHISSIIVNEIYSNIKDIKDLKCLHCYNKKQMKLLISAVLDIFLQKKLFKELEIDTSEFLKDLS